MRSPKAWGRVGSGNDAYVIAGEIKKLQLEDETAAKVFIDGKLRGDKPQGDSSQAETEADHTIVIDGSSGNGGTGYVIRGGGNLLL